MPSLRIDRLQPGVFISLSAIGWMNHPFVLNQFRIANAGQIQVLHEMGLKTVEWDPARSTAEPLPEKPAAEQEEDFAGAALAGMLDEKQHRIAQVRAQRERLARREREFEQEALAAADVMKALTGHPAEAHAKAKALAGRIVDGLVGAESVVVHLVNQKGNDKGLVFHSLNVMVIALLLGKSMDLSAEELKLLGVGALLHDVGKAEIPTRILRAAKRTGPEEDFYRAHIGYGIKLTAGMKELPTAAKNIIACHHEHWDGSGFPNKLVGEKIPRLARLVAIANRYDNLCNPFDLKLAKTPSETMQHLFRSEGSHFEPEILQRFIKSMGVYPPGTFVAVSNGATGLVVESNPANLLRPLVMVYDAEIPRHEALLLNLEEADLAVESAISPATLPLEVVEYLAPRGRVDYYVEGAN
ncbi:MAG TPA: HD domain-containing phosphohydrolase [Rhodocyclaceae bacterium]|nr:HD domain-containing phosphohydrolase [Rhodocyclaceae bacterium]